MHYTPSVLQLPFGSYSVFAMPGLVLGIAATAHATLPSAGPLVVSVLLNGGFEEPPLLPQQTSDEDEQIASWELSEGATLQWQEGDVPAYEGDACVRLYPGAWVEQTTSIGGEGSFVLSLWARQCGQAACSKDPCERPPLQRLTLLLMHGCPPGLGGEASPPGGREEAAAAPQRLPQVAHFHRL